MRWMPPLNPRARNQNIHVVPVPQDPRPQRLDALLARQVGHVHRGPAPELLDPLLGLEVALVALHEDDVGARAREREGHGLPDAAGAARDHGEGALEREELGEVVRHDDEQRPVKSRPV